jgi:hypothetical protein
MKTGSRSSKYYATIKRDKSMKIYSSHLNYLPRCVRNVQIKVATTLCMVKLMELLRFQWFHITIVDGIKNLFLVFL